MQLALVDFCAARLIFHGIMTLLLQWAFYQPPLPTPHSFAVLPPQLPLYLSQLFLISTVAEVALALGHSSPSHRSRVQILQWPWQSQELHAKSMGC